jgi:hypothetical protein
MAKKRSDKATGKSGGSSSRLVTTIAMTGGVFVMRKLLATVWTKVTGRTPPTDLTDPGVNLLEVLIWSVTTGLIVESARYAIIRGTMKRAPAPTEEP